MSLDVDDVERFELGVQESTQAPGERKKKASGSPGAGEAQDADPSLHGLPWHALAEHRGRHRHLVPSGDERPAQSRRRTRHPPVGPERFIEGRYMENPHGVGLREA